MAGRRAMAQNSSKTGRKRLVDKMNEQVRQSKYMFNGWAFPVVRSADTLMSELLFTTAQEWRAHKILRVSPGMT